MLYLKHSCLLSKTSDFSVCIGPSVGDDDGWCSLSPVFRSRDHRWAGEGSPEASGWDHFRHHYCHACQELQADTSGCGGERLLFFSFCIHSLMSQNVLWLKPSPHCQFPSMQFIQPSESPATEVMNFTLPSYCLSCLPAVAHYLRQNLLIFLHVPKYTDSNTAHHFKVRSLLSSVIAQNRISCVNPGILSLNMQGKKRSAVVILEPASEDVTLSGRDLLYHLKC